MTIEEFYKELENKTIEDYIVTLKYKYDFEEEYTITNEILEVEIDKYPHHYVWFNDWNEGQTDVEILGYIPVREVTTNELKIIRPYLEKIKQEINDLFNKPACYIPNYDAYKMFLEIIDKHLQEVE